MKDFLSTKLTLIFILFLIIPTCLYGDEIHSSGDTSNITDSVKVDSAQSSFKIPKWKPEFPPIFFSFALGTGRHMNFTKNKPAGQIRVESTNTHLIGYLDVGITYMRTYIYWFGGLNLPVSRHKEDDGYEHVSGLGFHGVAVRHILLPRWSKLNIAPKFGYKKLKERGEILYPDGSQPTLLDESYIDEGKIFGLEAILRLEIDSRGVSNLLFEYTHEDLEMKVNKYSIQAAVEGFGSKSSTNGKEYISGIIGVSLGIEHVRWEDGRKDWFLILRFTLEGNPEID